MAELQRAREQLLEAGKLIERIGARRFVPENLTYLAKTMRAEGRRFEARCQEGPGRELGPATTGGSRNMGRVALDQVSKRFDDVAAVD